MRRRLTASYVLLLVLVLCALEAPLDLTLARRDTQQLVADRLGDAIRFATLAEPALRTGVTTDLEFELQRYHELYGISAAVVDGDERRVVAFPDTLRLDRPAVAGPARRALAGQQADDGAAIWPWGSQPVVVAVPVGAGGQNYGAVVIVSPADRVARSLAWMWAALAVGGLFVMAGGVVAARFMARWTLLPVAELDAAVNRVGTGNYQVPVPADTGPPELRRLATAFNEMTAVVADVLERQRAFVSQASHQLRNPLTALRLRVEDLGYELTTDAAREGHRLALEETERLCQVLDSLLALARADAWQGREMVSIDPGEVALARVALWRPVAEQHGVTLRCLPPAGTLRVYALPTALDQALDAVIDNAVKFSGRGQHVTVQIATTMDTPGIESTTADATMDVAATDDATGTGTVIAPGIGTGAGTAIEVRVIDSGPGLTDEQRHRALERFWRAPDAQNIAGSGLGLPIAVVLIEASGGRLQLLPASPHGLQVRIVLPAE